MTRRGLRGIPSVDKLTQMLSDMGLPHPTVVATIRRELSALRKRGSIPGFNEILSQIRSALEIQRSSRIQPVINGTGILIHTNFGRAPLGTAVMEAVSRIALRYNNLEYGLAEGGRGDRAAYLEQNLALLCGAEAATVVNNNASALVLILRHFCREGRAQTGAPPGSTTQGSGRNFTGRIDTNRGRIPDSGNSGGQRGATARSRHHQQDIPRRFCSWDFARNRADLESASQQLFYGRICGLCVHGGHRETGARQADTVRRGFG